MRTTIIALASLGAFAAVLAACGGGGGGGSAPAQVAAPVPAPTGTEMGNQTVNNFTGASSQVTVTIKVPPQNAPPPGMDAHLRAQFGAKITNPYIRLISNTSPSATIRTVGAQQHRYAGDIERSTGRSPAFVSGATNFMEFVLSSGATVLVDDIRTCNTNSCTATLTVPTGTGYTATLYLYNNCAFLLGAGSVGGVSVVQGANPPLTITINGVAAYIDMAVTNTLPVIADPLEAQPFTVTLTPRDWNGNAITTPGVLLDSNFNQITGINVSQNGVDVTPATTAVTPAPNLSMTTIFNFAGTNALTPIGATTITFTGTEVAGSQLVPALYTGGHVAGGTNIYTASVLDTPATLMWSNPVGYPLAATIAQDPQLFAGGIFNGTTPEEYIEFPTAVNNNTYMIGLAENVAAYAGNVTITDNGQCGFIFSYPTITTPYQTFAASPYVQIHMQSNSPSGGLCSLTATDVAGRTALLNFYVTQSNLTIQNKARSH